MSLSGKRPVATIDLFCGAGGLTHGLIKSGIPVIAGIDVDPKCRFPYEANNKATFFLRNVAEITHSDLTSMYPTGATKILVGCAPCQPFSRYSQAQDHKDQQKWGLLEHFSRLIEGVRPSVVSMENVPELTRHDVFRDFVEKLVTLGYYVSYSNVFCPDYGIPQHRTRLVLFASLLGNVTLVSPTHSSSRYRTVKQAISQLPPLARGQVDVSDPLHRACKLSDLNVSRILASRPGGCWRDWPTHLVAECHRQDSGKTYPSVYGRMEWNTPAPTITTQFFGFGNGRFGHPEQDRAISLREGAILQSFPKSYRFSPPSEKVSFSVLGRLIGNAVPVRLGQIIGQSLLKHIAGSNV